MIADNRLAGLNAYIAAVSSGEQVACAAVKAAVERFTADLERSETKEFPYYFDYDAAAYAADFFPRKLRHTIGRFADLPFHLEPWQEFGIANIYGWKRMGATATRRFRRVFWTMARKNGKSTLTAGMAIHGANFDVDPATGKPEAVAQVVLAATKREQADMVTFAEVDRMCKLCLGPYSESKWKRIRFEQTDGSIVTVGSNKPYDGLNPSTILLDELHEWREIHRPFYDTMLTGGAARTQPLMVCTTTAGDTQSFIWLNEYRYAKQVAHQQIDDDKLFAYVFELDETDDPLDESVWEKANPNLAVSVAPEYLRDAAKVAGESVLDMNRFKRYHCNLLVDSNESVFTKAEWDSCEGDLSDWTEADAVGAGIDLGSRDDLASLAVVARFRLNPGEESPVYRFEGRQWSYIHRDSARDLTKAPFADWIHNEQLHTSETPLDDLKAKLLESCEKWQVESVAYDPNGGQFLAEMVENEGWTIASMGQNQRMMNEPIQDLLRIVRAQEFTHNGDPVLAWAMGNAVVVRDRRDQWMFDKKRAREKIDPAVSLVMAFRRAKVAQGKPQGSIYI